MTTCYHKSKIILGKTSDIPQKLSLAESQNPFSPLGDKEQTIRSKDEELQDSEICLLPLILTLETEKRVQSNYHLLVQCNPQTKKETMKATLQEQTSHSDHYQAMAHHPRQLSQRINHLLCVDSRI